MPPGIPPTDDTLKTCAGDHASQSPPGPGPVLTAAAARNPRIIIDLAALEYIDCHALGALVRVRAQARQAGGDLLLAAPRGPVRRLLDLTGLTGVFSVHASVDEAVRTAGCSHLVVTAG